MAKRNMYNSTFLPVENSAKFETVGSPLSVFISISQTFYFLFREKGDMKTIKYQSRSIVLSILDHFIYFVSI